MADKAKLLQVAQKHLSKGNLDKAIKTFQDLVEVDPRDQRLILRLADIQARAGRKQDAVKNYEKVAAGYIQQDFTPKAIAVYKTILRLDPELLTAYEKLAELYKNQGLEAEALSQLENLFQIYDKKKDEAKQIEVLRLMAGMDPENLGFQVRLGETLARKGQKKEAAEAFAKAATTLSRRGLHDRASQLFEKITALDPDNTVVRKELCAHYLESGQFQQAQREIEAILAVEPDDPRMVLLLGRIHFQLGNKKEGEKMIARSLQLFMESGELESVMREFLFVAQSHMRNGEIDESEAFYRQIVAVAPGETKAIKGLVSIAETRKDRVGQIENLLLLGKALHRCGDTRAAGKAFGKVHELDPLNEEAGEYLKKAEAGELDGISLEAEVSAPDQEPMELGAAELEEVGDIEEAEVIAAEPLDYEEGMEISAEEELEVVQIEEAGFELDEMEEFQPQEAGEETEAVSLPDIILEDFGEEEVEFIDEGGAEAAFSEAAPTLAEETLPEEEMTVDELLAEAEVYDRYGLSDKVMETLEMAREKAPDDQRILDRIEAFRSGAAAPSPLEGPPSEPPPQPEDVRETFAEDLEEAEFYLSQGLEDEACRIYLSILQRSPGHPEALAAVASIEGSGSPAAGAGEIVPEPPAVSAPTPAPEPPKPPHGSGLLPGDAREVKGKLIVEDSTFEDAGGFLDLADELRTELAEEFQTPAESHPEDGAVTFEEIFSQFKKGIEETLGDEEYETHYNLGIAYKDMGLYDDALREFEIGSRDPDLAQDSLSLMAVCFVEKKDIDSAVKAINKALELAEKGQRAGLLFQLGHTQERNKAWPEAVAAYEEVLAIDPVFEGIQEAVKRSRSHLVEEDGGEMEIAPEAGMDDMLSDLIREVEEMARETADDAGGDSPGKSKKDRISYL